MEKFKFVKDGVEKECHCHEGVYEQLLKEGWAPVAEKTEEKPEQPKKKSRKK